jgi:hypothetical protein
MTAPHPPAIHALEQAAEALTQERRTLATLAHVVNARNNADAVFKEFTRAADLCAKELDALCRRDPTNLPPTPAIIALRYRIDEARTKLARRRILVRRFQPMYYQCDLAEELLAIYETTTRILEDRLKTLQR